MKIVNAAAVVGFPQEISNLEVEGYGKVTLYANGHMFSSKLGIMLAPEPGDETYPIFEQYLNDNSYTMLDYKLESNRQMQEAKRAIFF